MGGMQGFGAIPYQPHEPVFHARWEGRAAALDRALLAWGAWNFDAFRHQVEQLPPPDYLRMSYWERRLTACIELAVKTAMISREEITSGQPQCGAPKRSPALTAEDAASRLTRSTSMTRSELAPPRYCPGDAVRARNINPSYHSRLPRYARGRTGVVQANRGAMLEAWVRIHATFTQCDSQLANYGVTRRIHTMPSMWICGKTTLSRSENLSGDLARFAELPHLPKDVEGPVFAEPWQAQAFALTVGLHNAGRFSWAEWTTALAIELRVAAVRGEPDDGSHYYEHWLSALEHLVTTKGLTEAASLDNRRKAWAQAYRATPHGRPVELG